MAEQAAATKQVADGVESLKVQATQTARAMTEQSRTIKDLTATTGNVASQIKLITRANLSHSASAESTLQGVAELRRLVTESDSNAGELTRDGENGRHTGPAPIAATRNTRKARRS
jgi:methyl-accepting chemotaxis protein